MEQKDIILIVVFALILFGLIGYLVFILLKDKIEIKKDEKFSSLKESSLLNGIDSKKGLSREHRIESITKSEVVKEYDSTMDNDAEASKVNAAQMQKPLTREEREKMMNPFGVDMTKRQSGSRGFDPNNKFFK